MIAVVANGLLIGLQFVVGCKAMQYLALPGKVIILIKLLPSHLHHTSPQLSTYLERSSNTRDLNRYATTVKLKSFIGRS